MLSGIPVLNLSYCPLIEDVSMLSNVYELDISNCKGIKMYSC